jgi:nucleoside-triphosphatase
MSNPAPIRILLTGVPGCGKTTVVVNLAQRLGDRRMAGFVTEEIRENGKRTGFQARTLRGERALLASLHHNSWVSVGRYGVDVESFEALVLPEITRDPAKVDLFLLDEIGKMACFCPEFVKAARQLLQSDASFVATVSPHGKGFINEVKDRDDVKLMTVTPENRAAMPDKILDHLG